MVFKFLLIMLYLRRHPAYRFIMILWSSRKLANLHKLLKGNKNCCYLISYQLKYFLCLNSSLAGADIDTVDVIFVEVGAAAVVVVAVVVVVVVILNPDAK